ncbi:MAG: glycosyltransferase [Desulfobacula sp.]|uniref:glycosyltransferase family 2 protein n=1 Tax=Desulfobacula sp. TaxID=2593537 RepID=UPI001DE6ED57|nr:glycosyltransferase [Desulfobacula sp.]MBT3487028.1 glycosyltransferase [Desulfobacula sp.]MBT3806128.1 glycosyltransferase [Desulfobacula sp.]MBT4026822.1 glycosyltransferase [Desulfobacula sp.]MBT4199570.1 glycosyltransferase [Desulfobacula sp.]
MKKYPLVSVILPSYNRAWTLKDAVDSVLLQDYPNIELIIIDDGSDDDTQELLGVYKNKITVLCQENKGVSAARNKGIKASRGKFIALLDSDDAWDKRKISCQMEFFNDHPEALICQTEEIWIRNGKKVNPKVKHKKPSGMIFEQSLHLCLVSPSSVMMKRQLFDMKGYFNETFLVCEDYDLWLRVSSTLPVFLIDKPYTIKRGGHKDQLSNFHSQDKFRIQSLSTLIESGSLTQEQVQKAKKVLKKKCVIYGNGCIKRGKNKEGESYLGLAESV